MELSIDNLKRAETFVQVFSNLKIFTNDILLYFKQDGLYLNGIDSSHVSAYKMIFPVEWFNSYNKTEMTDIVFGINTKLFAQILNTRMKTQTIKMIYNNTEKSDVLNVQFTSTAEKKESDCYLEYDRFFQVPLMELDQEVVDIPEFEYQVDVSFLSEKLMNLFQQLNKFGDVATILCSEEQLILKTDGEEYGRMTVPIPIDEVISYSIDEDTTLSASFSLKYLNHFCQFYKVSTEIDLAISANYPMKVMFRMECGAQLQFHLAPKMDDMDV